MPLFLFADVRESAGNHSLSRNHTLFEQVFLRRVNLKLVMQKDLLSLMGGMLSADLFSVNRQRQGNILNKTVRINSEDFTYQVYAPHNIENTDNLPVIIFLHGIRERGSNGFVPTEGAVSVILKQYLKQVPAIVVLPQCRPGRYWTDPLMEQMVVAALHQNMDEFRADSKRLYLTGVSMGGYGVWHFASKYPEKFAALVSICGGSPLMNGDRFNPIAQRISHIPVWVFHGADDKIVPVGESREMVKALEAHHGNVKYSEYAGVGHNVWLNALGEKDLMTWLLAQQQLNQAE